MKQKLIILFAFASFASFAQSITIKMDREDIGAILSMVKLEMYQDTVDRADNIQAVKTCERVLSNPNRKQGNVEIPVRHIKKYFNNKIWELDEYNRVAENYKQFMRLAYELYLADDKLNVLKGDENQFYNLETLRKQILREIKEETKTGGTDWLKRKYRVDASKLDDNGNEIK